MEEKTQDTPFDQRQILQIVNFGLVSLMLACFAYMLTAFARTLYPAGQMTGFTILAFLISVESLVLRHTNRTASRVMQNAALSILAEVILIALLLKLYTMLISGLSGFWPEIVSWQENFTANFFDLQYLLFLMGGILIWGMAWIFSLPLNRLEEDEDLMEQEKLGYTFSDRQNARHELITLTLILGFLMIAMLVVMKSSLEFLPQSEQPVAYFVAALLLYFVFAFILMALNQYAIMKARWYFNDIKVNPELAQRWLLYSVVFVILVIVLVLFLPTDFVVGFYPVAKFISEALVLLFSLLQFLIFAPIAFLISLLSSLLGGETVAEEVERRMPEFSPQTPELSTTMPWWDWVKSLLFWAIFLGVIIFAVRYYLNNQANLRLFFEKLSIGKWLKNLWHWIKHGARRVSSAASETLQEGYQKVRDFLKSRRIKLPSLAELAGRLPPRQAMILIYIDWVHWNSAHGFSRQRAQTPHEYARSLSKLMPDSTNHINSLTEGFVKARYSREDIDHELIRTAQKHLSTLKKALHRQQQESSAES
jgi:hypothetical protein